MAKKKESRKVAIEAVRTSRKRLLTNESPFAIKEAYVKLRTSLMFCMTAVQEMRRDFPAGELKPLSMILTSEAEGLAHTWGVFDGETLAAYLLMVRFPGKIYRKNVINL